MYYLLSFIVEFCCLWTIHCLYPTLRLVPNYPWRPSVREYSNVSTTSNLNVRVDFLTKSCPYRGDGSNECTNNDPESESGIHG